MVNRKKTLTITNVSNHGNDDDENDRRSIDQNGQQQQHRHRQQQPQNGNNNKTTTRIKTMEERSSPSLTSPSKNPTLSAPQRQRSVDVTTGSRNSTELNSYIEAWMEEYSIAEFIPNRTLSSTIEFIEEDTDEEGMDSDAILEDLRKTVIPPLISASTYGIEVIDEDQMLRHESSTDTEETDDVALVVNGEIYNYVDDDDIYYCDNDIRKKATDEPSWTKSLSSLSLRSAPLKVRKRLLILCFLIILILILTVTLIKRKHKSSNAITTENKKNPDLTSTLKPITNDTASSQSPSSIPTVSPSLLPSTGPTSLPSTGPTLSTASPTTTFNPTLSPSLSSPPSKSPSSVPTLSHSPTISPSSLPTISPSSLPSISPSSLPSKSPSSLPTISPSSEPSPNPSTSPSFSPSSLPTPTPSLLPSVTPSSLPTISPSSLPSLIPSSSPSLSPSSSPSISPSSLPSSTPSDVPSSSPTSRRDGIITSLLEVAPNLNETQIRNDPSTVQFMAVDWLVEQDEYYGYNDTDFAIRSRHLLERYVMVVVYYVTNGPSWRNQYKFLSSDSICNWNDGESGMYHDGIRCNSNNFIEEIDLSVNGLYGTLPSEIENLLYLERLSLGWNDLYGTIPSEFGNLLNLKFLHLYFNGFSDGNVPVVSKNTHDISTLDGPTNTNTRNGLTGTIPSELGNLLNIQRLMLHRNSLSGTIPSELGNLVHLEALTLDVNDLRGPIPTEIGMLTNLVDLFLHENSLTGTIPTELSNLSNLRFLWLDKNDLTGSIDPIFCINEGGEENDLVATITTTSIELYLRADCDTNKPKITCSCCDNCQV